MSDSVRITTREKCKETEILNIKSTFNRCSLPSLVIQQYDKILVQKEREKEESIEEEESFMRTSSLGEKRRTEEKDKEEQQGQKPAKKRRRWGGCYKDGEEWGQQGLPQSVSAFLYDGGKISKEDQKKNLKQTTIKHW